MKKISIVIACALIFLSACKKETAVTPQLQNVSKKQSNTQRVAEDRLAGEVSVSPAYGFLIMKDSNAYADYLTFLDSNSTEDIMAFHSSIGFTSQATVAGEAGNYMAPSTNNGEYVFSTTGMVQIGNMVYRGVNSEGYFLAMPADRLNETTYAALAAKEFDGSSMCKLKVGGAYGDNLEAFVNANIGFSDGSTPPAPPVVCGMHQRYIYSGGGVTIIDDSWYFLGIRYRHIITVIYP